MPHSQFCRRYVPGFAMGLMVCLFSYASYPQSSEAARPANAASSAEDADSEREPLSDDYVEWLLQVRPIMTAAERELFVTLSKNYQRDAFIRRFWQVRDPYPRTARNELKERWDERLQYALANYPSLDDARATILLLHGEPGRRIEVRCTTTRIPAEVWVYQQTRTVRFPFVLVFLRSRGGLGPASLWKPFDKRGSYNILGTASGCINGRLLLDVVRGLTAQGSEYVLTLQRVLAKPRPRSLEWVETFRSESTDLPSGASLFDAEFQVEHLGRHQSRTVVQGLLEVPAHRAGIANLAGHRSHDFLLLGEVLLNDQLLESFRYKYGFPVYTEPGDHELIPITFQRFLRPAEYELILRLEDLNTGTFYRHQESLEVPKLEQAFELEANTDAESQELFDAATQALALGATTIRIVPPTGELHTGFVRFDTLATGEIDRVRFSVDDREILIKNAPPFNVELDLGPFPRQHAVRAEALGESDEVVAVDELAVNAGGHRFSVRLIEPLRGGKYSDNLRARAEVQVPESETLERLELYLNEELVSTLYQEPFVQPIPLPAGLSISYVRAVAYLTDGNATEDLVFINSPDVLEEMEVQFVELYAAVADREGRPVMDLGRDDFRVIEDGVEQRIARFDRVEDLPVHVGIVIDNSASMQGSLEEAREAALRFLESAITPKDRAAIITFNRFPNLSVKLTNELSQLGGGLAGLTAEGQTALYDSLMFSLYYLTGISGQRALLLLSDGKDEVSRFSFAETQEYARRAGVTIYSVGLRINEGNARERLSELADETGGESFFISDIADLKQIYDHIERELRSQYLIAYQSSNTIRDERFRAVELRVRRPGVVAKTMRGYYP